MLIRILITLTLTFLFHDIFPENTWAKTSHMSGPVEAQLIEVIDGDTIKVRAKIWLNQDISTLVRLKGIDAPELRRPKCEKEKQLAQKARQYLAILVKDQPLQLTAIQGDKYFGRVLAKVQINHSMNLSRQMLKSGLVRKYQKGPRKSWCEQ